DRDMRLFVALEVERDTLEAEEEPAGQLAEGEGSDSDDQGSADEPLTEDEKRRHWGVVREHVMVNPRILNSSGRQLARDGCLSLPGLVAEDVPRPTFVSIEYQDTLGKTHRLEAEGYFAHVL